MSKVRVENTEKSPEEVEADIDGNESNLPATREDGAMAINRQQNKPGELLGDTSDTVVKHPFLKLVYGISDLCSIHGFDQGDIVLDDKSQQDCYTLVAPKAKKDKPDTVLDVIVISATKTFKEYLKWDPEGPVSREFMTETEVKEVGGSIKWSADGLTGPSFRKAMHMLVLVKQLPGVKSNLFYVELDGNLYAPARWSVDKKAYESTGDIIVAEATTSMGHLMGKSLYAGVFNLSTIPVKYGKTTGIVPKLKFGGFNTPEVVSALDALYKPEDVPDTPDGTGD